MGIKPGLAGTATRKTLLLDLQGALFALPWIVGFLGFFVGPMLVSLVLSLAYYQPPLRPTFAGLDNYRMLVSDALIVRSLRTTVVYALLSVPLSLTLGLALAVLVNQKVHGVALFRTCFYMPTVISGVAVALLWQWMFEVRHGLINYLLHSLFGIQGPNWLMDPRTALLSFVIMSLWTVGRPMLINLSSLQSIPTELYEAASLDGAGPMAKMWGITVPLISPVIFFNLVTGIIESLRSFSSFFIMTNGGPDNATLTFMLYLYNQAFQFNRMGYASAMAWVLFLFTGALTLAVFKSSDRWVYYEAPDQARRGV